MTGTLAGRNAVITGASRGLGARIAEAFAKEGANLVLAARTADDLAATAARLGQRFKVEILTQVCDVGVEESIDALAAAAIDRLGTIDILVNNAGILGPIGLLDETVWDDWKASLSVNFLGPAYACRAFLPHFRARGYGKIINLSGGGATAPRPRAGAYAAAKTALVRFSENLAVELAGTGICVNTIAPGAMATRMLADLLDAGPERAGDSEHAKMTRLFADGGTDPAIPAGLAVYLASAAADAITGKLIAAVWDPWRDFAQHLSNISETDIYTLRRVLPRDRGMNWGD